MRPNLTYGFAIAWVLYCQGPYIERLAGSCMSGAICEVQDGTYNCLWLHAIVYIDIRARATLGPFSISVSDLS